MITYIVLFIISSMVGVILLSSADKIKYLLVAIIIVITGSVLIYFQLGRTDYPDQPYQEVQERKTKLQSLSTDQLIARYEANLHKNDTPQTRMALALILMRLQRFAQAETHLKAAYEMDQGKTAAIIMAYAESKIAQNKGEITPEAKELIDQASKVSSENPKVRHYLEIYQEQRK